jgi:hypothetical protein
MYLLLLTNLAKAGRNMAQAAANMWRNPGDTGVFQKWTQTVCVILISGLKNQIT